MSRFDFSTVSTYAAALAVTIWSTSMIYAATLVPAAAAVSGSVA